LAIAPVGVAFGLAATDAGLAAWQASGFSLLVFAGSAQFAAVDILGDGGSAVAAITAGLLLNLRSLAFGVVMAPALAGRWWQRAMWSQVMIDEAAATGAAQTDNELRRYGYLWVGTAIFVAWNISTLLGATALPASDNLVTDWGIDAAFPAVFLALLWPRLTETPGVTSTVRAVAQRHTAVLGAVIAVALLPVAPAGLPILVACAGVAAGWRTRLPAAT
jgi:predicted branched-subunit amino acid permease